MVLYKIIEWERIICRLNEKSHSFSFRAKDQTEREREIPMHVEKQQQQQQIVKDRMDNVPVHCLIAIFKLTNAINWNNQAINGELFMKQTIPSDLLELV